MILSTLLYFLALIGTGFTFSLYIDGKQKSLLQTVFIISAIGLFVPVALLYLLAILHISSKLHFFLCWFGVLLFAIWQNRAKISLERGKNFFSSQGKQEWIFFIIHLLVLVVFYIYYGRPSEWVYSSGMDAGQYVLQAAYQTNHASLYFDDNITKKYIDYFPNAQFAVNPTYAFAPTFSFPPFNKLVLAVAMMFNLPLALYVHFFLAVVAYLAFAVLSEYCFDNRFLHIFTPVTAVSTPLFIFYSSRPMSEMLMLATLLSSLAMMYMAVKKRSFALGAIGGALLGMMFGVRLETILYFGPLVLLLIFGVLIELEQEKRKIYLTILFFSTVSAILFWYPAIDSGRRYYYHQLHFVLAVINYILPIILVATLTLWGFIKAGFSLSDQRVKKLLISKELSYFLGTILVIIFSLLIYVRFAATDEIYQAFAVYGKNVRRIFHQEDMLSLIRYTNPFLVLGFVLGLAVIAYTRKFRLYPIVGSVVLLSLIVLINPKHAEGGSWLVRRYLPSVFPLMIFSFSALVDWLLCLTKTTKKTYLLVIMLTCVGMGYFVVKQNVELNSHSDRAFKDELVSFIDHSKLFTPGKDVIIANGRYNRADGYMLGMTYFFGIDTISPNLQSITDGELKHFAEAMFLQGKNVILCPMTTQEINRMENVFNLEKIYHGRTPGFKAAIFYKVLSVKQ